jgi:hypothetical protein
MGRLYPSTVLRTGIVLRFYSATRTAWAKAYPTELDHTASVEVTKGDQHGGQVYMGFTRRYNQGDFSRQGSARSQAVSLS